MISAQIYNEATLSTAFQHPFPIIFIPLCILTHLITVQSYMYIPVAHAVKQKRIFCVRNIAKNNKTFNFLGAIHLLVQNMLF